MTEYTSRQPRLLLQFHITGRCNLRCKHCYREEGNVEPLSYEQVISILEQFKKLRLEYNRLHKISAKAQVNFTGGEPFIRKDIRKILEYMGQNREELTYAVLSNGSFLDDELVSLLKKTRAKFVQLSIDGNRRLHDSLRAKGDYDRVLRTAQWLERQGISTHISFTANRENYKYLPHVAARCRKYHITKLWSDRLVPIGNGEQLQQLTITEKELPDYIRMLKKARGHALIRALYPKTEVSMNRALQFQNSHGMIYSCGAGSNLITVDEFGNIMPCRRMPLICGNATQTSLAQVYFEHETFKALRGAGIPSRCLGCTYAVVCRGGAKCQSCAHYGSFDHADPACPLKNNFE